MDVTPPSGAAQSKTLGGSAQELEQEQRLHPHPHPHPNPNPHLEGEASVEEELLAPGAVEARVQHRAALLDVLGAEARPRLLRHAARDGRELEEVAAPG